MVWGTFLIGADSIWTIGETANFPGALVVFALIAYRLFWNQFQTYGIRTIISKIPLTIISRSSTEQNRSHHTCFICTGIFPFRSTDSLQQHKQTIIFTIQSCLPFKKNTRKNFSNSIKASVSYCSIPTWTSQQGQRELPELALYYCVLAI